MGAQSAVRAAIKICGKPRLRQMDWRHSPPPLTELTLAFTETTQQHSSSELFGLLRSLGGSLERLNLRIEFRSGVQEQDLVLPKLTHLRVSYFEEWSASLLGSVGFLAPNLEMLQVFLLRVRAQHRGQNGPGFSYVDLMHYCTKLRHLSVKRIFCYDGVEQRVDPPLQLQAGRPTLEILDWPRHRLISEFGFGLRPAGTAQCLQPNAGSGTAPSVVLRLGLRSA